MKLKMVEVVNGLSLNKIVIGNGTASQRTAQLVSSVISENGWMDVEFAVVSEAGSSVYSVSEAANEEFPNIDILFRGAINIGRRVLDPLSELVKIPVKSMGIGMYQHDVNEKKMTKTMNETVESCVASVGINAVTANKYMMEKVPGINKKLVHQIVLAREGSHFNSREDLRNVAGMNESVYKQIVGFFRFPNSKDPLDNTVLLPEWYGYVRELVSIAASEEPKESSPSDVIGAIGDRCLASVARYLSGKDNAAMKNISSLLGCGVECLRLIQKELLHPGMDPRSTLPHAGFMRRKLLNVRELKRGEVLSGVVQSVTPFGAFVDCGLEQHVLVRQLQMSDTHPGQLIEHIVFRELDKLGRPQVHLADHSGSTGFKRQREEEEEGTAKINKVEEHSPLPVGIIEI